MSTRVRVFFIALGALGVLLIVCKLAGVVTYYTIATPSNEPTLKRHSLVFTSIFKKPERFDFIVFKHHENNTTQHYIFRLCGLPGDNVEIKDGELFVNGQSTDTLFSTYLYYRISMEQYLSIKNLLKRDKDEEENYASIGPDKVTVPLTHEFAAEHNLLSGKVISDQENPMIFEKYHKKWSADNFGPLVIPEGHYFVLGDNRQNAFDSRYSGLINKEDFVTTVISD